MKPSHDWERGSGGWGWGAQEEAGMPAKEAKKKKVGKVEGPPGLSGRAGMRTHREPSWGGISQTGKANTRANDGDTQRKAANLAGARHKAPIPRTPAGICIRPWPKTRKPMATLAGVGGNASCGGGGGRGRGAPKAVQCHHILPLSSRTP